MPPKKKVTPDNPFPDPREMFIHVKKCVQSKFPDVPDQTISDLWERGLKKNEMVLKYLQILLDYNRVKNEVFRVKSYRNAIGVINKFHIPIISGNQMKKYKGIGSKIASKIQEILDTNGLKEVDVELQSHLQKTEIITELSKVWSVGVKTAEKLVAAGIESIDDLRNYPELLNDEQRKGLKYHNSIHEPIPRNEITQTSNRISSIFREVDPDIKIEVCGSYRRGSSSSGDIDILISSTIKGGGMKSLVEALRKDGMLLETFKMGDISFTGVVRSSTNIRQLDIHTTSLQDWGAALLHFTGSGPFNVRLRAWAKNLGYKLSDKGLFKGNTKIKVPTEKDVFRELGVDYLKPSERV